MIVAFAAVAAWQIYDMATATETPSRSLAILQYALLAGLLIGLGGAVLNLSDRNNRQTPLRLARRGRMATARALVPKPATLCAAGQAKADGEQTHNRYQTRHDDGEHSRVRSAARQGFQYMR